MASMTRLWDAYCEHYGDNRPRPITVKSRPRQSTGPILVFVNEYLRILNYCDRTETFDRGVFMIMHDTYSKAWQKLNKAEQGEISYRLSQLKGH